jgi:hypothetical protein
MVKSTEDNSGNNLFALPPCPKTSQPCTCANQTILKLADFREAGALTQSAKRIAAARQRTLGGFMKLDTLLTGLDPDMQAKAEVFLQDGVDIMTKNIGEISQEAAKSMTKMQGATKGRFNPQRCRRGDAC